MRRLPFWVGAWAWIAQMAILADRLRLAETEGGGWLCLGITLAGVLVLRRFLAPSAGGER